uniref:Calcineurin-like phosphoesterase domain-containing protein n=1 Tax=Chromera velia CCMP2878 TaxID=1169474 RepID=A0A0K6SBD6_9ALVE|eukprot:Cvel_14045.t1-p1 / transcript=Cvel_14045.t1 / gene=Cvel_14045 / organism=Chromera_velia_CCMP2878 / gene_product=hypothetical protein / transcript_product=hypothetical protein / location=Cvel_scaffold984:43445-45533(-) / protein_length=370 / sequence_SO=supercontig / SO=protein_coding / is_pseudo=false
MSCETRNITGKINRPSVLDCDVTDGGFFKSIRVDQSMREQRWKSVQKLFSNTAQICTTDKTVHGAGNSYVTALVGSKRVPLVFLDSGTGLARNKDSKGNDLPYKDTTNGESLYDWVRPSQVKWMKGKIGEATTKGMIFTHHPPALTTKSVSTFQDSFDLDDVDILSGSMWVGSRNHGKPDQGEKGGKFETDPQSFGSCILKKTKYLPVITATPDSFSLNPKDNWNLELKAVQTGEVCTSVEPSKVKFFDGPTKDSGDTLMQAATKSKKIAALFSGHHHDNDYCAKSRSKSDTDILFCYGGTAGYTAATYADAMKFGPRPKGAKLEHQVRVIHYTLPQAEKGEAQLKTWLVRDVFEGELEHLEPLTVQIPL